MTPYAFAANSSVVAKPRSSLKVIFLINLAEGSFLGLPV